MGYGNKLFGVDVAKLINQYVSPGVLPAVLTKVTVGTRTTNVLTGGTNPTTVNYACKGFIDSQNIRDQQGGLTAIDQRNIILIGDSIATGAVPELNDRITIEGVVFQITGPVDRDPAKATYICPCTKR